MAKVAAMLKAVGVDKDQASTMLVGAAAPLVERKLEEVGVQPNHTAVVSPMLKELAGDTRHEEAGIPSKEAAGIEREKVPDMVGRAAKPIVQRKLGVEAKPSEGGGAINMWSSVLRKHDKQGNSEPPTKGGDETLHYLDHARKSLKFGAYSNRASIMAEQERMSAAEAAVLAEARPEGTYIPSKEAAGIERGGVPGMVGRATKPLERKLGELEVVVVEEPQSVEEEGVHPEAAGINTEDVLQRSRIIV
jgi:hypothetical protein